VWGRHTTDELDESRRDGRRPKAYVRFEQFRNNGQSGPMYGPFDGLEILNDVVSGKRRTGEDVAVATRKSDGLWYLSKAPTELGYSGFVVLFS